MTVVEINMAFYGVPGIEFMKNLNQSPKRNRLIMVVELFSQNIPQISAKEKPRHEFNIKDIKLLKHKKVISGSV